MLWGIRAVPCSSCGREGQGCCYLLPPDRHLPDWPHQVPPLTSFLIFPQIGILVVNCSLFNPTPSLSAMIINHFKLRSNIVSYNLSGMGCSAGIIAIDCARQMLQLYPGQYALVCSTENITQNWSAAAISFPLNPIVFYSLVIFFPQLAVNPRCLQSQSC